MSTFFSPGFCLLVPKNKKPLLEEEFEIHGMMTGGYYIVSFQKKDNQDYSFVIFISVNLIEKEYSTWGSKRYPCSRAKCALHY